MGEGVSTAQHDSRASVFCQDTCHLVEDFTVGGSDA